MTPREFRQEKDFEFDHFQELTSTGIKPNYVNIERFAEEYHQSKLKNNGDLGDVSNRRELLLDMFDLAKTMPDNLTKADKMKVVNKFISNNCC